MNVWGYTEILPWGQVIITIFPYVTYLTYCHFIVWHFCRTLGTRRLEREYMWLNFDIVICFRHLVFLGMFFLEDI